MDRSHKPWYNVLLNVPSIWNTEDIMPKTTIRWQNNDAVARSLNALWCFQLSSQPCLVSTIFLFFPLASPSLPRYFLFSITGMSLFRVERAECPLRVALPCSSQCYFYCSFTAQIHRWSPFFSWNSLCLSVGLSLSSVHPCSSWWEFSNSSCCEVTWFLTVLIKSVFQLLQMDSRPGVIGNAMTARQWNSMFACFWGCEYFWDGGFEPLSHSLFLSLSL